MARIKNSTIIWIVVGVIVLITVLSFIGSYNKFATLEERIDGQWSEVENQYERQASVIPNLVSTVSSQVGAETQFVKDVTEARASWAEANSQIDKDKAGQEMNSKVNILVNAVAENYPTLLASEGYIALRDELVGAQNRITVARGKYIENIQGYNTAVRRFPGNVVAGIFGFEKREYYKASEGSMSTPNLGDRDLP